MVFILHPQAYFRLTGDHDHDHGEVMVKVKDIEQEGEAKSCSGMNQSRYVAQLACRTKGKKQRATGPGLIDSEAF